jgi:hypothetical protein
MKDPVKRGTYAQLLEHPFIVRDKTREIDMVVWVETALARRDEARKAARAATAAAAATAASPTVPLHPPSLVSAASNSLGSTITQLADSLSSVVPSDNSSGSEGIVVAS